MADSNKISETPLDTKKVDLDSLKELSFGPSWLEGKPSTKKEFNKDNKNDKPRSFKTKDNNGAKDRRGLTKKSSSYKSKNFKNVLAAKNDLYDIKIYPEDETFDAIIKRLKNNLKPYQFLKFLV